MPTLKYERIFAGADECSICPEEKPIETQSKTKAVELKSEDDTNSQTKMAAANSHVVTLTETSLKSGNIDRPSSLDLKPSIIGVKRARKSSPDDSPMLSFKTSDKKQVIVTDDMQGKFSANNLYKNSIFTSDSK